jgi:internalin A
MDILDRLVGMLKEQMPDNEILFNPGVNENELDELEKETGMTLPGDFRALYRKYNGEGDSLFGFMAGFSWMTLERVRRERMGLVESAYSILSDKPGYILEGAYQKGWIPLADDGGGSFLAMDLMPGPSGTYGQIITIDHESDISYVIADNLGALLSFIEKGLSNGDLTVNLEEDEEIAVINWRGGHLFNDVSDLTGAAGGSGAIPVEGFWMDFFREDLVEGQVPLKILAKMKMVFIRGNESEKFGEVSLNLLKHMVNLKELIIHANNITSFGPLREIPSLAQLVIGSASFQESDLSILEDIGNLKQLTLASVSLRDLSPLQKIKTLKRLRLYNMPLLDCTTIGKLTSLTELSVKKIDAGDLSFLSSLTKLTDLELEIEDIPDLEFLRSLNKLKKFKASQKARDESGLELFCSLSKLVELNYPIGDMTLVSKCPQLTEIDVDAEGFRHVEALKTSSIKSVTVHNAASEEEAEGIIAEIKQYCSLNAYGWSQSW